MATNVIFASPRFDVEVTRSSDAFGHRYAVRYGLECKVYTTVSAALDAFNSCIQHARQCDGDDLEGIWAQSGDPRHGDDDDGSDCDCEVGCDCDCEVGCDCDAIDDVDEELGSSLDAIAAVLVRHGYTVSAHFDLNTWQVLHRGRLINNDAYRSYAEAVNAAYRHLNGICR